VSQSFDELFAAMIEVAARDDVSVTFRDNFFDHSQVGREQ
jgi:hypothetical protein